MRNYLSLFSLFAVNGLFIRHELMGLTVPGVAIVAMWAFLLTLLSMELWFIYRRHRQDSR